MPIFLPFFLYDNVDALIIKELATVRLYEMLVKKKKKNNYK